MALAKIRRIARAGRNTVGSLLVRSGFYPPKGTLTILTYHRVLNGDHPGINRIEPGMFVSADTFDDHLKTLRSNFDPIQLSDWVNDASIRHDSARRYVAITFDDGWHDNFSVAFKIVRSNRIPVSIFLMPGALEQQLTFWTEDLAHLYFSQEGRVQLAKDGSFWRQRLNLTEEFFAAEPDNERLAHLVSVSKNVSDEVLQREIAAVGSVAGLIPATPGSGRKDFMDWEEAMEMAESEFVEFGCHSYSHKRLDSIEDEAVLNREIVASGDVLRQRFGASFNNVFCYPNGNVSAAANELVRNNYSAACTVARGHNGLDTDPYRLTRHSVHQDASSTQAAFLTNMARTA